MLVNRRDRSEMRAEAAHSQVSLSDASISSSCSGSSPSEPAPFVGTVIIYTGSAFTSPEAAVPTSVPAAMFGSPQDLRTQLRKVERIKDHKGEQPLHWIPKLNSLK